MKHNRVIQILLVLFCISIFSSCRSYLDGIVTKVPAPYVRLKNGTKTTCASVTENKFEKKEGHIGKISFFSEKLRPRIFCGETGYKFDEVAAFSDGERTYANLKNKNFAYRFGDGKINTYVTINTKIEGKVSSAFQTFNETYLYTGAGEKLMSEFFISKRHNHHYKTVRPKMHFYLQQGEEGELYRYSYRNMALMIPKTDENFGYLNTFRLTRIVGSVAVLAGIGMMIAGANIASTPGNQPPPPQGQQIAGDIIGYGGLAIAGTGLVFKLRNHNNLDKALYGYNEWAFKK